MILSNFGPFRDDNGTSERRETLEMRPQAAETRNQSNVLKSAPTGWWLSGDGGRPLAVLRTVRAHLGHTSSDQQPSLVALSLVAQGSSTKHCQLFSFGPSGNSQTRLAQTQTLLGIRF